MGLMLYGSLILWGITSDPFVDLLRKPRSWTSVGKIQTQYCSIRQCNLVQWNPAYRGRRVSGHPSYRGRSLGICFFRFKNNPAYRGAIHLTGHSTEDFFTWVTCFIRLSSLVFFVMAAKRHLLPLIPSVGRSIMCNCNVWCCLNISINSRFWLSVYVLLCRC